MSLSTELITQFVKATNDTNNKQDAPTSLEGIVEFSGGKIYVKLKGSSVLTPATTLVTVENGDYVTVSIENHKATITGNLTDNSATKTVVANTVAEYDAVIADKVSTAVFEARAANIENLIAENANVIGELKAEVASIENLEADTATITGRLNAVDATILTLETDKLDATIAEATYATIEDLDAAEADIYNLQVVYGEFHDLVVERLDAAEADIDNLEVNKLDADVAEITYAKIADLNAANAEINNLEADVADINTLIFGSATGDTIQASFANAVIAQLGNAQIKSAMIENVSASKITSGDIITNNVRVKSEDGSLLISDETMQISDDVRVRVQIGKDASNDYSINIWDADGNLMFNKGGITDSAIKDAIIRNDMVSDTANIAAHKLDIDSLFEEINGSTKTIKSTQIYLDDEAQTLDVAFESIITDIEELQNGLSSQGTQLTAVQGQIATKVWQSDIDTAIDEVGKETDLLSTNYTTLSQTVDAIDATVASHTSELNNKAEQSEVTEVKSQVSELELNLSGFESTVSSTYATNAKVNNVSNIAQEAYNNTLLQSDVTNYAQLNDDTASKWGFTSDQTSDGHWYTMNTLIRDKFISGWHLCDGGERFRVSFEISTSAKGNTTNGGTDSVYRGTAVGLYCYDAEGSIVGTSYSDRVMASDDAPTTSVSKTVALSSNARKFRVFIQTESYGNFSGTIKIRNVRVEKIDKALETIVTANQTKITQNSESITAVSTRVTSNETALALLEMTADGLTTRVTTNEANIETALASASNAQTDIDELEIGGRNLFENSATLSTSAIGRYFSPETPPYTVTIEEDSTVPSGSSVVCSVGEITTAVTNGGFYLAEAFGKYVSKMIEGETYTVSVWAKGSRNMEYGAITAEFLDDRVRVDSNNLTTEWQRFILTGIYNGHTTSSVAITFYYNSLIQSNDTFYFSSPKIEKGNRATDWTPAPEDMATSDDLDEVQSATDLVETRVTTAETLIEQLSDCIAVLVRDANGESLMTQTEDGWTFSTANIQETINTTSESLNSLTNEVGDVNSTVSALQQAVADLGILNDYVKIGTYEDEPCIELGETDSEFKLLITNTRIMFMEGSGMPAYITNQSLHIKKAVIEEEMQQGEFVWKIRSNGNLGLTWKGVTS